MVVKVQRQASGMNNQGFKIAILHFKDRTSVSYIPAYPKPS
jgi:hypothetical protein